MPTAASMQPNMVMSRLARGGPVPSRAPTVGDASVLAPGSAVRRTERALEEARQDDGCEGLEVRQRRAHYGGGVLDGGPVDNIESVPRRVLAGAVAVIGLVPDDQAGDLGRDGHEPGAEDAAQHEARPEAGVEGPHHGKRDRERYGVEGEVDQPRGAEELDLVDTPARRGPLARPEHGWRLALGELDGRAGGAH